ncbi:MAG: MFS transporter [Sarcina sp.]
MESSKKRNIWIPFLVALPSMGIGIIWNMNSTVIPMLIGTTTSSATAIGNIVMMAPITGIFMPYIAGIISDRTTSKMGKRKPWVILGTILASISLLALGLSTEYVYMFIFATLLYGLVNFYVGPYFSLMPESVEKNQIGLVNGWGKLLMSLGGVIFFLFGVNLYNSNHLYPFILVLILLLVPTLIAMALIKEDNSKFQKPSKLSLDFLKNSAAMRVFMTAFFFYLGYGLIMPYMIPYFTKVVGFTSQEVSIALTVFTFMGLILSFFIGLWCDRSNKQIILFIACAIYGIGFLVGIFAFSLSMLWVFTLLSGVGFVILQVVFYALIPDVAPKEKLGEYMGINNVFLCIPQIIGNQLGGHLLSSGHHNLLFPLALASAIVACIIIGAGKLKFKNHSANNINQEIA